MRDLHRDLLGLISALVAACLMLTVASPVHGEESSGAAEKERVYLYLGTFAHFDPSPDHREPAILGGVEWRRPSNWLYGLTLFNNSYGQFSQYAYVGKRFELPWKFHAKLTGGVIHGYKGRFQEKIPLNNLGIAPAIVPSIGIDVGRFDANLAALGLSGLMVSLGYDIWD